MDAVLLLASAIGMLLLLMLTGLPVFVAFFVIGVAWVLIFIGPAAFGMFANSIFDTTTTATLATIPMFVLMGEILFRSGSGGVLLSSVDTLIGALRGRQYVVTISLATILGALSGSAMAVSAMLGRTLLGDMEARGYDRKLSCGTILAGATLAPIIPPSILAIITGTLANVSIAKLLMAGVMPGILLATLFVAYVWLKVRFQPELAPADDASGVSVSWAARGKALLQLIPFTGTVFMVMGLILLGVATPSEAGATGVLAAVMTAAVYRTLTYRLLWDSLAATAKVTAMILVIMAAATFFSQLLSFSGSMTALTSAIAEANLGRWTMLALMLILPFLLCMFIDQIAMMLVVVPIFAPLALSLGFDPVWFWALFVINISVGGITPPFGYAMFVLKAAAPWLTLPEIYRAVWPFVGIYVFAIVVLALIPQIVTFLPARM